MYIFHFMILIFSLISCTDSLRKSNLKPEEKAALSTILDKKAGERALKNGFGAESENDPLKEALKEKEDLAAVDAAKSAQAKKAIRRAAD